MGSFGGREALPEESGLAVVVPEALAALADLVAVDALGVMDEGAELLGGHHRAAAAEGVGLVLGAADRDLLLLDAVVLVVVDGDDRAVDGDVREIRAAEAEELGVEVREEPGLQERIVGKIDAWDHVGHHEGDLLCLGEEVVRVSVQRHLPDAAHRHELFGDELGGVEDVEGELVLVLFFDDLDAELVLGEGAGLDRVPEIAAVEVRVLAGDLLGFVPDERVHAEQRLPVELGEAGFAFGVDEAEGVDAEALHHAVAAGMARSDITHSSM